MLRLLSPIHRLYYQIPDTSDTLLSSACASTYCMGWDIVHTTLSYGSVMVACVRTRAFATEIYYLRRYNVALVLELYHTCTNKVFAVMGNLIVPFSRFTSAARCVPPGGRCIPPSGATSRIPQKHLYEVPPMCPPQPPPPRTPPQRASCHPSDSVR